MFVLREGDGEGEEPAAAAEGGEGGEGIDEGDLPLDPIVKPTAVVVLEGATEVFEKRVSVRACVGVVRVRCV